MTDELFSMDAELNILGCILQNPDASFDLDGLRWFMFSSQINQSIFKEIEEHKENNLTPDSQLIVTSLESKKELTKIGGKKTIENLLNQDCKIENITEYVRIVVSSYKARTFISMVSDVKPENLNLTNIDEKIYEVKKSLDELSSTSNNSTSVLIGERIKETFAEIAKRTESPGIRGTTWGVNAVDTATGGKSGGDVLILSARPSIGKTAIACNSILADGKNGVPSLFIEKEMTIQSLIERLTAIESGIPITNIRQGILNQKQLNLVFDAMSRIKEYPIYLYSKFGYSDLYIIENMIKKHKYLYDIKNVYVDYIQLLTKRDTDQTNELGRISKSFKELSIELDICSIILSQLNRQVEMREDKRPQMSDLRQSGNLEEDADWVIGLYRDEYYNKETKFKNMMEFIILKARNGPVGTVTIKFIPETNAISDLR